jgi:RNA polymerase sigma-B factor
VSIDVTAPRRSGRELELDELHEAYARTRDPGLRTQLVEQYAGLARALATRFAKGPDEHDDLTQVAMMALLKAVDRFDPARGIRFTTYAWATIRGEMKRYRRDRGWGVHVSRRLQELYLAASAIVEDLTHAEGRSPTMHEVADHLGVSVDDVVEALELRNARRPLSIDQPAGDEAGFAWQPSVHEPGIPEADGRAVLSPLLARLPARQREILHLRFVEDLTQSQIALRVGLSQMHVSRLLNQSLATLRQAAAG